jgi:hypothetical protein
MIITAETIEFDNLSDLCIFLRYNPQNEKSVPKGYTLARDVVNNEGGLLYAKDSEIDGPRIGRLLRIIQNNPDLKPQFAILLNETMINMEKLKIQSVVQRLIESKLTRKEFNKMMMAVKNSLDTHFAKILGNNDIILYMSKMKFLEDKIKKTKINPFYNHMLNTLIFSIGIVNNLSQVSSEKFTSEEIEEIGLVALLHSAGGWETAGEYLDLTQEEQKAKYIEANSKNYNKLKQYKLSGNVLDAIEYTYQYSIKQYDFFQTESRASSYAKTVIIASLFDELITGLWEVARTPREVTDSLYVLTQGNKLPKIYVDALAKGLKFDNLFDFYHELEVLKDSCKRGAGRPYPMTGFKSPIIFVCQKNIQECKEFLASSKSITVFKEIGGLEAGAYGRCEGLSAHLMQFYDGHYKEIKDEVLVKSMGLSSDKSEKPGTVEGGT